MDLGMPFLPGSNLRGLVRRRVVEDYMQLPLAVAAGKHLEKPEEVGAGVPLAALSNNLAGGDLQSRVEARQSIPTIVVRLAGRQSRPQRQDRLRAVQSLYLGLLVHTQNNGVGRGIQVEPHHVVDLLLGLRVGTELERLDAMRLQVMSPPDSMNGAVRDPNLSRQITRTPVRHAGRRRLQRHRNDLGALAGRNRRGPTGSRLIFEPREPLQSEAPTEPADLDNRVPQPARDLSSRDVLGHQQHHACPAGKSSRHRRRSKESLKFCSLGIAKNDRTQVVGHVPSPRKVYMTRILT